MTKSMALVICKVLLSSDGFLWAAEPGVYLETMFRHVFPEFKSKPESAFVSEFNDTCTKSLTACRSCPYLLEQPACDDCLNLASCLRGVSYQRCNGTATYGVVINLLLSENCPTVASSGVSTCTKELLIAVGYQRMPERQPSLLPAIGKLTSEASKRQHAARHKFIKQLGVNKGQIFTLSIVVMLQIQTAEQLIDVYLQVGKSNSSSLGYRCWFIKLVVTWVSCLKFEKSLKKYAAIPGGFFSKAPKIKNFRFFLNFLCCFQAAFLLRFFLFCSSHVPVVVGGEPRPTKNWTHITIMGS